MKTFMKSISEPSMRIVATLVCFVFLTGFVTSVQAAFFSGLGDLPGGEFNSVARDISADGNTIVGSGRSSATVLNPLFPPGGDITIDFSQAFRWTQNTGVGWFR